MHYSYISAAFLAIASTVVGQDLFDAIQTPQRDEVLPAGKPYDLVWNPLDVKGTATIQLQHGTSNISLQLGPILKAGVDNQAGKYSWTPEDLGFAVYGWTITLDSDKTKIQTSPPFAIKKEGGSTTTIQASKSSSSTSTMVPSSPAPSTTSMPTVTSSSEFTMSTIPTQVPSSNVTWLLTTVETSARTPTSGGGSSPTTSPPAQSSSAAMANLVSGGFAAMGGLLMAFAL